MAAIVNAQAGRIKDRGPKQKRSGQRGGGGATQAVARALHRDQHLLLETAPGSHEGSAWLRPVVKDAVAGQGHVLVVTATGHRRQRLMEEFAKVAPADAICAEVDLPSDDCGGGMLAIPDSAQPALLFCDYLTLFACLTTKRSAFEWRLPPHLVIVLDEAQLIEALARRAFGFTLSMKGIRAIVRELEALGARDIAGKVLDDAADFFRQVAVHGTSKGYHVRLTRPFPVDCDRFLTTLEGAAGLVKLAKKEQRVAEPGLEPARQQLLLFAERLFDAVSLDEEHIVTLGVDPELSGLITRQPARVARPLGALFDAARSVILVSETLSAVGSFRPLREAQGVPDMAMEYSPWPKKSGGPKLLLVVPEQLPDPSERDWPMAVACRFVDIQKATGGRACGVFTSDAVVSYFQKHLRYLHMRIRRSSPEEPVLVDLLPSEASAPGMMGGEAPRYSCIIIDRLPFPPPDDAFLHWLKDRDQTWFTRYSLPHAIIALRRAILPLMRGRVKRAALVVLDRRLLSRSYSRLFLDSLPELTVGRSLDEISSFLAGGRRS